MGHLVYMESPNNWCLMLSAPNHYKTKDMDTFPICRILPWLFKQMPQILTAACCLGALPMESVTWMSYLFMPEVCGALMQTQMPQGLRLSGWWLQLWHWNSFFFFFLANQTKPQISWFLSPPSPIFLGWSRWCVLVLHFYNQHGRRIHNYKTDSSPTPTLFMREE